MNTQTLLNNVATGTIKVLQDRTQDMGINWNKVGEFNNFNETKIACNKSSCQI